MPWRPIQETQTQFSLITEQEDGGTVGMIDSVITQDRGTPPDEAQRAEWSMGFQNTPGRRPLLLRITCLSFQAADVWTTSPSFEWGVGESLDSSIETLGTVENFGGTPAIWAPTEFEVTIDFAGNPSNRYFAFPGGGESHAVTTSFLVEVWEELEAPPPDRWVRIRYSKDGGYTHSLWRTVSLGQVGEYQDRVRVRLRRIGMARSLCFEIETSSPFVCDVIAAVAQIEGMGT